MIKFLSEIYRVKEMESALEDIQEKLWELDKSWKNNLVSKLTHHQQNHRKAEESCDFF